MAANQNKNLNGVDADTVVLDDEYTPPTPEERGDFIVDDEDDVGDIEDLDVSDDELEDDELEDDENEGDDDGAETDLEEESDEDDDEAANDSADDEADGEEEERANSKKNNGNKRVPLNRLNKEIEKRRNAEGEIADLRKRLEAMEAGGGEGQQKPAEQKPASAFTREDFEGMQEAMLDGETDKAFDLFGRMMASQSELVRESTEKEVSGRVRSELEQDRAHQELQSAAATLAESYPELDSANEDADQGLIEEVVEMRDIYVDRGLKPADALKRSVKLVALENELEDRTAKPKADMGTPSGKRKPVNSKAKLEAAKREKGKLAGSGLRNSRQRVDISTLPEEEFSKLSKEALAQARGDYV